MADVDQIIASLEAKIDGYVTKLNDATTSEAKKDMLLQTINYARDTYWISLQSEDRLHKGVYEQQQLCYEKMR